MIFEQINRSAEEIKNSALNSKLYECSYSDGPEKPDGDKGSETKDKQKDSKETPEQRIDQKIKDQFGAEALDHLKDHDWLIDNRKKLEDGFKKADNKDVWDMALRMRELSMVDGKPLIYMSKVEGKTAGTLIPKRYDIYLRRGSLRSDNYIGHAYH